MQLLHHVAISYFLHFPAFIQWGRERETLSSNIKSITATFFAAPLFLSSLLSLHLWCKGFLHLGGRRYEVTTGFRWSTFLPGPWLIFSSPWRGCPTNLPSWGIPLPCYICFFFPCLTHSLHPSLLSLSHCQSPKRNGGGWTVYLPLYTECLN